MGHKGTLNQTKIEILEAYPLVFLETRENRSPLVFRLRQPNTQCKTQVTRKKNPLFSIFS